MWLLKQMVSAFTPFAQCYLLGASCFNITACTVAYIGGCTLKEEHPLQQLDSKKGSGLISRVGLFSRDYGVYLVESATMDVMNITPYQQLLLYVPHARVLF